MNSSQLSGSTAPATDRVASPLRDRMRRTGGVGQYAGADPVQLVAAALGKPRSVAAQMLKFSDPRCPAVGLVAIVAALNAGGRGDVAERLCLPLDIARRHVTRRPLADVIADAQKADLSEDLAENEARSFPSDESYRRWLRQLKQEHAEQGELIAALESGAQ